MQQATQQIEKIQNLIINAMPQYEGMIEFNVTGKHSVEMNLKAIISPSKIVEALSFMTEYMYNYGGYHVKTTVVSAKTIKISYF